MRPELDKTLAANSPALEDTQAPAAPSPAPDPIPAHTLTAPGASGSSTGSALAAGVRLGHFRIDRKLGAGGMGEVYLATDLALDRPVAIKVLPAGTTSGLARDRLIREARAQARVQHPNVAHIYFIGEDEGRLYFAMELVGGVTLADKVAAGPLSAEEALAVTHAAALGLREAQRSGFMHRDVKPSNLMVDAHGVVKVLDFGLAAESLGTLGDGPVEQTTMAGTPLYMAPEQARGEPIDLRSDIYALGATLFHLVSGAPPFRADTVAALVTMHASANRPPVPRGANPRTAVAAIDRLIARMMAPRPDDRFASYDELLRAIELVSVAHTRPAGFWVRGIAFGVDVLVLTIVLGLLNLLFPSRDFGVGPVLFPVTTAYTAIMIGRWGRTIGKALFELEVVSAETGGRPSWAASARRAFVQGLLPTLAGLIAAASEVFDLGLHGISQIVAVVGVVLVIGALVHAVLRVPGKRAPWDRVAGTIVRYRRGA